MYTYKIHLHKEPEGGYTVSVPAPDLSLLVRCG
jgi:predicted RNase H-like HicB family nuclease